MRTKFVRWFAPTFAAGFLLAAAGGALAGAWTISNVGCVWSNGYLCPLPNVVSTFPVSKYGKVYFDGLCSGSNSCIVTINKTDYWTRNDQDYTWVNAGFEGRSTVQSSQIKNSPTGWDYLYSQTLYGISGYGDYLMYGVIPTTG